MSAALTDLNVKGFTAAIHELASRERRFYCWLSSFRRALLAPLHRKGARPDLFHHAKPTHELSPFFLCVCAERVGLALGEPCTQLLFSLCESFGGLSSLVGRHAASLSYFLHDAQGRSVTSLPLLTHTDHFQDTYRR